MCNCNIKSANFLYDAVCASQRESFLMTFSISRKMSIQFCSFQNDAILRFYQMKRKWNVQSFSAHIFFQSTTFSRSEMSRWRIPPFPAFEQNSWGRFSLPWAEHFHLQIQKVHRRYVCGMQGCRKKCLKKSSKSDPKKWGAALGEKVHYQHVLRGCRSVKMWFDSVLLDLHSLAWLGRENVPR